MQADKIRSQFLTFFEQRGHKVVPSSSLIPQDPTLLLTGAGMNQFKSYLLGIEEPAYPRAATAQKVFRAVDIENVGHTARHLTFFEMLGNFSFGDYFKSEACRWAFELITEGYGIDPDRLWMTVYEHDDEALRIWTEEVGVPRERIVLRGIVDAHGEPANFWWMHAAGPCGPCSEIFVDRGPKYGPDGGPDVDEDRFCEIWNLVFMQDECDAQGNVISPLPKKNIDTGSSLERVAMVLQGADNAFETDLMRPLLAVAEEVTGHPYGRDPKTDVALRIMAEHGRATTFLMADGVLPSNEGRGYVLRRELRRLITYARKLGVDRPIMGDLVRTTVELMGDAYPELRANEPFALQVASSEEERFVSTYRHGMTLFDAEVDKAKEGGTGVLSGEAAFRLHDTFGFQDQLTIELAAAEGLAVDTDAFARLMAEQRRRASAAAKKGDFSEGALGDVAAVAGASEFVGYEHIEADGLVVGLLVDGALTEVAHEGQEIRLVLSRTPFYAEGGGQVGDEGAVRTAGGMMRVTDVKPGPGGTTVHTGIVESGEVRTGEEAHGEVDAERRASTARSHTATHVLHHTLRHFLGEHARQAGSLVAPGRFRFDFTHHSSVPRESLEEVEYLANRRLGDDSPVRAYETTYQFAQAEGAMALFGEKYGDIVRVIEIGDYSIELCGGTHVRHTGEVSLIRLLHEASIGSGFRRIEALVGPDALQQVNVERRLLEEITEAVGSGDAAGAPERVRKAIARVKLLESELGKIHKADQGREVERLASTATDVAGSALVVSRLDGKDADALREMALALADRLQHGGTGAGAAVLGAADGSRALLVAACTKDLVARGVTAGELLEVAARTIVGGAGGKKPNLAFAGGSNAGALDEALRSVEPRLLVMLGA